MLLLKIFWNTPVICLIGFISLSLLSEATKTENDIQKTTTNPSSKTLKHIPMPQKQDAPPAISSTTQKQDNSEKLEKTTEKQVSQEICEKTEEKQVSQENMKKTADKQASQEKIKTTTEKPVNPKKLQQPRDTSLLPKTKPKQLRRQYLGTMLLVYK